MRPPRRGVLALALAACLTTGCRLFPPPPPPPIEQVVARGNALPFRLALAPVRVDAARIQLAHALAPARHGTAPDPDEVRRELAAALRAASLFRRVEPRGAPSATAEHVAALAWDAQDDAVLEVEVRDAYAELLGHSSLQVVWFVVYAALLWPAWFVPVDWYGAGLEAQVTLRGVQGGEPIFARTYRVTPRETRQELTPRDRGLVGLLDLPALWSVESWLEASNWEAIDGCVGPHARHRFLRDLVSDLRAQVANPLERGPPAEREVVLSRLRKRFALVVGLPGAADPALGSAAHAGADALAMAELFEAPEGGGLVRGRDLVLLVDAQATRQGLLSAVAAVASRVAPSDEVVVYVAGLGTTVPSPRPSPRRSDGGGAAAAALAAPTAVAWTRGADGAGVPALVPFDARPDDLAGTCLPLHELGAALARIEAAHVVLLLDASFSGAGGRTLGGACPAPAVHDLIEALRLGPGRAALLAAQPAQAAQPLASARAGLFTYVVRHALRGGAADAGADGRVSFAELAAFVRVQVLGRSGLEGQEQEPLALGDAAIAWPR